MAKKSKSDKGKRATAIVANVFANVIATKSLSKLHEQTFMQAAAPKAGEKAGINMKKAGADLGATALGVAVAMMIPGDISLAAGSGLAAAGVNSTIDTVTSGMNGMGATDDILNLYKETGVEGPYVEEGKEPVNMSGDNKEGDGSPIKL